MVNNSSHIAIHLLVVKLKVQELSKCRNGSVFKAFAAPQKTCSILVTIARVWFCSAERLPISKGIVSFAKNIMKTACVYIIIIVIHSLIETAVGVQ